MEKRECLFHFHNIFRICFFLKIRTVSIFQKPKARCQNYALKILNCKYWYSLSPKNDTSKLLNSRPASLLPGVPPYNLLFLYTATVTLQLTVIWALDCTVEDLFWKKNCSPAWASTLNMGLINKGWYGMFWAWAWACVCVSVCNFVHANLNTKSHRRKTYHINLCWPFDRSGRKAYVA